MNDKRLFRSVLGALFLTICAASVADGSGRGDVTAVFDALDVGGSTPATGFATHRQWIGSGGKSARLDIALEMPVPNELPGFDTLADAKDVSFVVTLGRGRAVYAQCTVNASRVITLRGRLRFALEIFQDEIDLKWQGGLCDLDPWSDAIVPGVPDVHSQDMAKVYVQEKDRLRMLAFARFEGT